jgi:hypothetical protein
MINISEFIQVFSQIIVVVLLCIMVGWGLDHIFLKRAKKLNPLLIDLSLFQEQGVWQLDAYGISKVFDQFDLDLINENLPQLIVKLKPGIGPVTIDLMYLNQRKTLFKKARYRLQGDDNITIGLPQSIFGLIPVLVGDQKQQYEWNLFSIPKTYLNLYAFFQALSLAFAIHFLVQFILAYYSTFTMTCPICQFQLANDLTNVYILVIMSVFILSFFGIKRITKILYNHYFNGETTYDFNR